MHHTHFSFEKALSPMRKGKESEGEGNFFLNFKNSKLLFTLILISFCGLACAQVPDYDGVGPQVGDVIHIQDGDEVFIASSRGIWPDCRLDSIDHFPGIHILYTHGWGCIGNTGIFTCDAGEGSFYGSYSSDIHGGVCSGPERNFDIDNETGYSIKSIYFDANSYRTDSHSPDRSTWLAWQTATPGQTRSTDFGGGRLGVDTDYGHLDGNGIVGTLTIQSDDFKDPDAKSIAQAAVVQNNYNNPDGNYLLTSSVTINNPGPYPVATPIACAIPPASGQFSTDKDSPGKSVLLPSIMEAKLHLCVIAPTTSNQYHFYNIGGLYTNLDTDDTKLYPKILDSTYETNFESGYLSESLIYSGYSLTANSKKNVYGDV